MKLRRSVRFYLALSYAVFVLVVLGGSGLYWFWRQEQMVDRSMMTLLEERARLIATLSGFREVPVHGLPSSATAFNQNLRIVFVSPEMQVQDLSEQPLSDQQQNIILKYGRQALVGETVSGVVDEGEQENDELYAAAPIYSSDGDLLGVICLLLPIRDVQHEFLKTNLSLVAFALIATTFSILLGIGLASLFTRPLSAANQMAARLAGGDYGLRLAENGPKEVNELANHLNLMAEELENQTNQRTFMLSSVSHELARPLGGLRLGVDSLRAGALEDPALADDLLNDMALTIQGMEALLDDLSLAAMPVTKPLTLDLKPVAVEPFLKGIHSRFWPRAESQGIQLKLSVAPDLPAVAADEQRLNQILSNLMDNAFKFTPLGGQILLTADRVAEGVQFCVQDSGPGIPPKDMDHIFEPFYQAGNSKKRYPGLDELFDNAKP